MKTLFPIVTFISLALTALPAAAIERGDPARGEQQAQACLACHSANAVSANPAWPRIQGQYSEYLVHALQAYKSGDRQNAIMNGQVANLSTQDMRDLAAWFASQDGDLYTPKKP